MDSHSFDRLTRLFAAAPSRRGVIGALLSAVPALLGLAEAAAKPASRRRISAQGPCGDGGVEDNTCTRHNQCCTGFCNKRTNRCRCRHRGQTCRASRNCCSRRGQRMTCRDGRCQAPLPCGGCPAGEVCAPGVGTCCPTADVCTVNGVAGACCDDGFCCGNGQCQECCATGNCPVPACQACTGGTCVPANEDGSCGTCQVCQGGACVDAADDTSCGTCQVCQGGQCVFADACAGTSVPCGIIGASTCTCHKNASGASVCGLRSCQPCPTPGQPCAYNAEQTGICISCVSCPGGTSCMLVCTEPLP